MTGDLLGVVKVVAWPIKSLVVDKILDYFKLIRNYGGNLTKLQAELEKLCLKKYEIDEKVLEGKKSLQVMTRATTNWIKKLQVLIGSEDMKKLLENDEVAKIAVKMMEQRLLHKLFMEDRKVFDILLQVVKQKCSQVAGHGEEIDPEEDADYKKVAKIVQEVIRDTAKEFKMFLKEDDAAAAVQLLNDDDLKKLKKDDVEMAKILSKAEETSRKEIEHNSHNEDGGNAQPVDQNIIKEKLGILVTHMGSLMTFLDNDKFKKSLPESAKLGLEVMYSLSKNLGLKATGDDAEQHMSCGCCVVPFDDYRHRHDMSQRAERMMMTIKSMIDDFPQGTLTRLKRDDELENISSGFMKGLESREDLLQRILSALTDDQVNVVGVFGMGGSGKTTLAKEVAGKRSADLFNKRLVVEVSEIPNIQGIQDQIAEGINLSFDGLHTTSQRAHKLYNALISEKKQRILIVLDNMWKELKLDEVGVPGDSTKDFCCKLMITTRERRVCRVMNVQDANIFKMGMLSPRESIDLFENQTGVKVDTEEYKPVVDRLLRKCGGLPLTIAATGSALRGRNLTLWCQFAEESEKPISSLVSREYCDAYSILETSYKLMDIEEKWKFFFLACLTPLDSAVVIDDLMRYAIGLDLFQRVNSLSEAMEQAHRWANELISSSLLLKGESDGQVKIHDVVRASAISFAEKGKEYMILVESIPRWMSSKTFEKLNAISLLSGHHSFPSLSGVKASLLEILLLKGDDLSSTTLTSDFFVGMKNLNVLSLSNMNFMLGLPESMAQLEHLRTLHLHHCLLGDIKLVGKLVNLLVLSLRGSTLKELANEIGELSKLRLLDMGGCKGKTSIGANILSRLSHLEGLYMFNSFDDWSSNDGGSDNKASVSELNNACHLNVLEIEVPEVKQLSTLNDGQLRKFRIHVGDVWNDKLINEKIQPYHRILELNDIDASQSECLKTLFKITDCLLVYGTRSIENFVPDLDEQGFKDLKYFYSSSNDDVKCLISSKKPKESVAFANLEVLHLFGMGSLERMCDGKAPVGLFSNLRCLTLEHLMHLKYGLPLTHVPLNLVEVSITGCTSLKFIFIEHASEEEPSIKNNRDIVWLPFLKSLTLEYVSLLSSIVGRSEAIDDASPDDQAFFNAKNIFPSLEILKLEGNETIVTLWSTPCDVSSFHNLKVMEISSCNKLKNLGYPSIFVALVHLEELSIRDCHYLKEVITKETEGYGVREHSIVFPALKRLFMSSLPFLKRFYAGSYKLDFPNLKSLTLELTESMTTFDGSENTTAALFSDKIKFPCLEELDVQQQPLSWEVVRLWDWSSSGVEGEIESGSNSMTHLPSLKKLCIGNELTSIPQFVSHNLSHLQVSRYNLKKTLLSTSTNRGAVWTYDQFPKLENVCITRCSDMEELFENEDDDAAIRLCGRLTGIILCDMPQLKMVPFHLLKNIRSICVSDLSWKYVFSADLFISGSEQLQLLENLEIWGSTEMEAVIMVEPVRDDQGYIFPHLKTLKLDSLSITSFASKHNSPLHFPSLESVDIEFCYKIQLFCSGPFSAPKLKHIRLWACDYMEYFLSGNLNNIQELSSLESVDITVIDSLLAFSSQPLVAPKLHQVSVSTCGKMKWFSPVGPNHDALEFPSLEMVSVEDCPSMKSFSTGRLKTPKLSELIVDKNEYSKQGNKELEQWLGNLDICRAREVTTNEGGHEENMNENKQGEEKDMNENEQGDVKFHNEPGPHSRVGESPLRKTRRFH